MPSDSKKISLTRQHEYAERGMGSLHCHAGGWFYARLTPAALHGFRQAGARFLR
jgi:hypothetical protein